LSANFAKSPLSSEENTKNIEFIKYEIKEGDSLWSIASYFETKDIEMFIYNIKKLNDLDNLMLTVDEILLIPSNI
jgi:archaellum biogenesis ATPase FlaH